MTDVLGGRLEARKLSKTYELESGPREIIRDFNLTLEPDTLTVVMGPSGCGKSVLINLLAGYEEPTTGQIILDGREVSGPGPDRLVVFQEAALFPWLTTYENVAYSPKIRKELGPDLERTVMELLRLVGLEEFRDKYPSQLSGGMQRRAELARAIINPPKATLLDEPFRGLDALTRSLMRDFYLDLFQKRKGTHLFVTSELDEGLALADTLVIVTNRPSSVKKILKVDLPRPRENLQDSKRGSQDYLALKAEALELLYEEARKSFKAGSLDSADFVGAYAALS